MLEKIRNEPARVVGVVLAALGLLSAFNLGISDEQTAAVVALVGAVLALVGAETVRAQVTPTRKLPPEDGAGDALVVLAVAILIGVVLILFGVRLG